MAAIDSMNRMLHILLLAIFGFALAGCATTDENQQSDIPWNAPQSWEGSPGIPGLDQR